MKKRLFEALLLVNQARYDQTVLDTVLSNPLSIDLSLGLLNMLYTKIVVKYTFEAHFILPKKKIRPESVVITSF